MLSPMAAPEVSVVIPSHARRLRLRWLLNALEEQTLEPERFEVIVVHDYDAATAAAALEDHPLRCSGVLDHLAIEPGTGSPARQRNLGWRAARAPLIAFTDDDCRPDPAWLERLLATAGEQPGSIVQGATRPDPLETANYAAPHHRTLHVDPPGEFAQTCNIAYPRETLEEVGGFDESLARAGEDLDLALRARERGARLTGAPDALVYHAIEAYSLPAMVGVNRKWRDVPRVVRRHPSVRELFDLRLFWRRNHLELSLALVGLLLARRTRLALLLAIPYLRSGLDSRGSSRRARLLGLLELPGRTVVDLVELETLIEGSLRYRTPVL